MQECRGKGDEGWSVPNLRLEDYTVVVGYHSAFGVVAGDVLWRLVGAACSFGWSRAQNSRPPLVVTHRDFYAGEGHASGRRVTFEYSTHMQCPSLVVQCAAEDGRMTWRKRR
jgi:hypothetical protein